MPLNIVAALAVKRIMERDKLPGTLMLWPGVAEELLASKAWFVRDGVFKDVDVCLFAHVGSNLDVRGDRLGGNGLVSVEYTFSGESAHSAGAPWRGRSALDAVELMNVGWNYKREHLRIQQRSHYVITDGGDQPNVVPSNATVWYYFRETEYPHIKEMWDFGNKMAEGAALMTGDDVDVAHPRHGVAAALQQAGGRGDVRQHQARRACRSGATTIRRWPRRCRGRSARRCRTGSTSSSAKLDEPVKDEDKRGGGSDDIGDVSWTVPTVTLRYPVEHSRPARPQLGERHRDGHADRAQGRRGRRQGPGDDDPRSADEAGAGEAGVGATSTTCRRRT